MKTNAAIEAVSKMFGKLPSDDDLPEPDEVMYRVQIVTATFTVYALALVKSFAPQGYTVFGVAPELSEDTCDWAIFHKSGLAAESQNLPYEYFLCERAGLERGGGRGVATRPILAFIPEHRTDPFMKGGAWTKGGAA